MADMQIYKIINSFLTEHSKEFFSASMGFVLIIILLFFFSQFFISVAGMLMENTDKKHFRNQFLQEHSFERYRISFNGSHYVIYDSSASINGVMSVVLVLEDSANACKICDILNCDCLGEIYSEKKCNKLSLMGCNNEKLKSTKGGERK